MLDARFTSDYTVHMDAAAIRRLRAHLNLKQEEFAQLVKASRVSVSDWERGIKKPDRLHHILLRELADKTYGPLNVSSE